MKKRKCKQCGQYFQQQRPLQYLCSWECASIYAKELEKKKEEKEWKKRKKVIKEELKTHSDYVKELQIVFNKYIRLRDKGKPCISCDKPLKGKFDAGHFYSVGSYPNLRFNEINVHGQCVYCNQYKGGNIHEYRKRLKVRIGIPMMQQLDRMVNTASKLYYT